MIWVFVLLLLVFLAWLISKSTYKSDLEIIVNAPRSHAFSVAMDESLMGQWLSSDQMTFKSMENISGGRKEIGSQWKLTYEGRGREIVMSETVTDYRENELFAFDIEDSFAKFHVIMRFEDRDGGTLITERTEGTGKSIAARAMLLFFGRSAERTKRKMYEKLKSLIESPHTMLDSSAEEE